MEVGEIRELARVLHAGQVDKAGAPYELHVLAVGDHVAELGGTAAQVGAAYLHDAIEDTEVTPEALLELGVPAETVEIVVAMTRTPDEQYTDYLDRLVKTESAVLVKYCDLINNLDPARQATLDEETRKRLTAKYQDALARLGY